MSSKTMRVGYLGPIGTFSYEVAEELFPNSDHIPFDSLTAVVDSVIEGQVDRAVLPFSTSATGDIPESLNALSKNDAQLEAVGYHSLVVEIALMVSGNSSLANINLVASKDVVFEECSNWISENLPSVSQQKTESTAAAAMLAASNFGLAAMGSVRLAERYGLSVLATQIENRPGVRTEFVILKCRD